ncbi:MAG: hypothetical protein LQ338_005734 [Usnochroma carphineum]|nr:MAG: hypothetical protein LQ338_005734 [Usnochroma carphineum]
MKGSIRPLDAVALVALIASAAAVPAQPSKARSITSTQPPTDLCGNDQHIILDGTPWLVANSLYGAAQMVGTSCTKYNRIETGSDGNPRVVWGSRTAIQDIESTGPGPVVPPSKVSFVRA